MHPAWAAGEKSGYVNHPFEYEKVPKKLVFRLPQHVLNVVENEVEKVVVVDVDTVDDVLLVPDVEVVNSVENFLSDPNPKLKLIIFVLH